MKHCFLNINAGERGKIAERVYGAGVNRLVGMVMTVMVVMMMMSGCGLYKKYERPSVAFVDSLYRRMDIAPGDTVSTAAVSWEQMFTDPVLQEWIRLGLEHNTDMNVARLKVEESQAYLLAARRALFPQVGFSASGGLPGSFSGQVGVSWDADIFGSLRNAKRKAAAAVEQSEAYRQAVQTQLVATIANNYYMLLMLDEQLNISKRTLTTWEENIRAMEALKRAGKTNEAAVLQAKANKLSVEASILTLEKEILAMENSFCALLGTVPMAIERGTLSEQKLPEKLCAGPQVEQYPLSSKRVLQRRQWSFLGVGSSICPHLRFFGVSSVFGAFVSAGVSSPFCSNIAASISAKMRRSSSLFCFLVCLLINHLHQRFKDSQNRV